VTGLALDVQAELDAAIDRVLDLLETAAAEGVEVDPLATIIARLQARGTALNMDEAPPMMRMLLGGMLG
jgi:hypothetical protein